MLFSDTYRTIEGEAHGLFKDRGSRFIAIAIPVSSKEEIKNRLGGAEKRVSRCQASLLCMDARPGQAGVAHKR